MASSSRSYYEYGAYGGEDAYALSQNGQNEHYGQYENYGQYDHNDQYDYHDPYDQHDQQDQHGQYEQFDQNDETTLHSLDITLPPHPSIRISGETLHNDFNGADPSHLPDGHPSSAWDSSSLLQLGTRFQDTPDSRQMSVTPDIDNGFTSPHTPSDGDPGLAPGPMRQDNPNEPWNSVAVTQPGPQAFALLLPSPSQGSGRSYSQRSSQGPGSTSSRPRWYCAPCDVSFVDQKTLTRHLNEAVAHQDDDSVYICKCGKTARRKHNFTNRHFRRCGHASSHGPSDVFTCICSYPTGDAADMERHWRSDCQRQGKRGRKPKSA